MRRSCVVIAVMLLSSIACGQSHVSTRLNVDRQPIWGPTGYDHVEYYYLPDIDIYYNVPLGRFYYYENSRWTNGTSLPARAQGFDLYSAYKVVVNETTPYRRNAMNRAKYGMFKGRHDQEVIRDSRDTRYVANPRHPEHNAWLKQQKQQSPHDNRNQRPVKR